jgi:hypothetical protein
MRTLIIGLLLAVFFLSLSSACKKDEDGDQNKPFIILNPPNPLFWGLDVPYADPGATAYDVTESGDTVDITGRMEVTGNVDVSTTGDYVVNFNVSDEAGNAADQKTRNVKVVLTK